MGPDYLIHEGFEFLVKQRALGFPGLAEVAALAGDPARAGMLHALMDGRALTASELARTAGITPQTCNNVQSQTCGNIGNQTCNNITAQTCSPTTPMPRP